MAVAGLDVDELTSQGGHRYHSNNYPQVAQPLQSVLRLLLSVRACGRRWRTLPPVMYRNRVTELSKNYRACDNARIGRIEVILHGGEPLLAGPAVAHRYRDKHWPEICRSAPNSSCCSRRTEYCWTKPCYAFCGPTGFVSASAWTANRMITTAIGGTRTDAVATRKPTRPTTTSRHEPYRHLSRDSSA